MLIEMKTSTKVSAPAWARLGGGADRADDGLGPVVACEVWALEELEAAEELVAGCMTWWA